MPVTDYLQTTGSVSAFKTVDLVARVEGYLRSVDFKDGSIVKAGTLLFVIEPEPYQAKLASQQAQLLDAQSEYDRQLRMIKQNATSQANVEKWLSQRDQAAAAVTLAKINLGYTRISAPFDGRVDRHLVDPGNLVGSAGTATKLATIEQIDPAYVYFSINERDLLRVRLQPRRRVSRSARRRVCRCRWRCRPRTVTRTKAHSTSPPPGSIPGASRHSAECSPRPVLQCYSSPRSS